MEGYRHTAYSYIDRFVHSRQGKVSLGISPVSQMMAYFDWLINLTNSPGKRALLMEIYLNNIMKNSVELITRQISEDESINLNDVRFKDEAWGKWPYSIFAHSFLRMENWWHSATAEVAGVSRHHENMACFVTRQFVDMFSPSNFVLTNPIISQITQEQFGGNLINGFNNFLDDWKRLITKQKPAGVENFKIGQQVAITPGKVILRNRLIELIQYSPSTDKVYNEPILIVPAWIMKYYILDLSPHNSLVKYLVDKGHTVFMISWKNPDTQDRNIGMDEYLKFGVLSALDAISAVVPGAKIHTLGYCIGGTLLAIAAATMARDSDDRLQSMTLLAAQTDFTEAGELMLFIDENQVDYLEDLMWNQGYLDTSQMAGTFQILNSNDLIWSKIVNDYLLGKRRPMIDLMAWNADATRMPYYMHSQYLRRLFLNNELSGGRYTVDDKAIALSDIHVPVFLVATFEDHVAPWRSVYKFHLYSDSPEITFALTSGGHNAGIVNEPQTSKRTYQIGTYTRGGKYVEPDLWKDTMPVHKGSWWVPWQEWLIRHSEKEQVAPPPIGNPEQEYYQVCDAPGSYVLNP